MQSPGVYWTALVVLLVASATFLWVGLTDQMVGGSLAESWAWWAFVGGLSVIWAGGARSLAMWWRSRAARPVSAFADVPPGSRIALLYCTADDFAEAALRTSMGQTVGVDTVILDDSSNPEMRAEVDEFVARTGAQVIRRRERTGFKAGNLNHAMSQIAAEYDYVVVLDSDTVLQPDFVSRALSVFVGQPGVGIVQSRVEAGPGSTRFTGALAGLLGTHIRVTQAARDQVGFSHFLGRGAMVSTKAFAAAGGVPELVMEDVAFSMAVRRAGYQVVYAPEIVTLEDYPVDYAAFRTQYRKMIEGATELMLESRRRAPRSGLRWWERVDLVWEQLHPPMASLAGFVVVGAAVVLASDGHGAILPVWAAALTSIFVAAPLLPEAVRLFTRHGVLRAARFLVLGTLVYGSTMILAIRAAASVLLRRRARFIVTPKRVSAAGQSRRVRVLALELTIGVLAVVISVVLTGSLFAVIPLVVPAVAGFFLLGWSHRTQTPVAVDNEVAGVSERR